MRTAELQSPTVGTTCSVSGLQWVLEERLRGGTGGHRFLGHDARRDIVLCRIFYAPLRVKGNMESEVPVVMLSSNKEFHTPSLVEMYLDPEVVLVLLWSMIEHQAFSAGQCSSSFSCCRRLKNVSHVRDESARGSRGSSLSCSRRVKIFTHSATCQWDWSVGTFSDRGQCVIWKALALLPCDLIWMFALFRQCFSSQDDAH